MRGVLVHVFLAGEQHDLVHDLVGGGPQHERVCPAVAVSTEVDRPSEAQRDRCTADDTAVLRHRDIGSDDAEGHDRCVRLERHADRSGLPAIEAPIRAAGPLGIDPQQVAPLQESDTGAQTSFTTVAAIPIDRDDARASDEPTRARGFPVVGLPQVVQRPREREGQHDGIDEGEVVTGDHRGSGRWDMLETLDRDLEVRHDDRGQRGSQEPVQTGCAGHLSHRSLPTVVAYLE